MKKFYLAFTFALIAFSANAQQPFITTWEVTASDLSITIPTQGAGYNYTVDFGDGTVQSNVAVDAHHTYSAVGTYTVSITGTFPRIYFVNSLDPNKLKSVEQWGDIQWATMEKAFWECSDLVINATDAPDLSQVTNMSSMFYDADSFNQSINKDVSNVTNMTNMFASTDSFNQSLSNWDVSNVTNMTGIFAQATSFNQPLNNWDVSNVTNLSYMFSGASVFDQPLNNWNVSNANNMSNMFSSADSFNQPLNNWDVSGVTNMSGMFSGANSFNQPLNNWDVSNVTNMVTVFWGAHSFDQPLNNWDVSNVTDMTKMFSDAESFNQPLDSWDVSSVTAMSGMFSCKYSFSNSTFNQPLDNWDVSNVTNMSRMFSYADSFNQPLNNWDVSNVTDMLEMFKNAGLFNQPLNNWDVSNVTRMKGMFQNAGVYDQPLNNWDVSNVTNMESMFWSTFLFNQPLNSWDVSSVTNMESMFKAAFSFNQPLNNWDISNVTNMEAIFANASSFNQDLSNWNFNQSVSLTSFLGEQFISHSGMDINNYDALLSHLASLDLDEKELGVHNLEYCNQAARNELVNNGWTIYGDNLSPNCNMITGTILYDENNNGCDPNDIGTDGIMVNIDDGTYNFSTFVNNGSYNVGVAGTSFTVSVVNVPTYYTVTPPTATVTFTTSDTEQQDFCVTATQTIEDLNVVLLPVSQARPGFEADYQLVVKNMGTQTVANASVNLSFDDTKQSFTSANPAPSSTTTNQLTFGMSNLLPFEVRTVDLAMQTFTPPTVNGDDILSFTASVMPDANDNTLIDNTFNFDQIVVNSFDPNDKQVLQGEEIFISEADEYLNYLIRFQNTGTASAINVRVLDTLHPKLDWNSIRLVNASHDYRVEITDGNRVEFIFENINLPHEAVDEPGSHGFIAYKIKPKSNVQIGDIITGDARIYFDFNAPIITNMVSTEIVPNLSTENFELDKIQLYPNPTNGILNISSETELEKVELFSITGNRLLLQESNLEKIDLHQFSEGIYFLKTTGKNGVESVEKIVKK